MLKGKPKIKLKSKIENIVSNRKQEERDEEESC
jgi:hypothetical protein